MTLGPILASVSKSASQSPQRISLFRRVIEHSTDQEVPCVPTPPFGRVANQQKYPWMKPRRGANHEEG